MATSLADEKKHEAWIEPHAEPGSGPMFTRAELLWTLLGVGLLGAFLSFVVDDFPLRTLISVR